MAHNGDTKSRQNKQLDLRNFINAVTDHGVHGLSATGEVTRWNVGASRLDGYDYDDIIGKSFEVFFDDPLDAARLVEEATNVGHAKHSGWRVRKDGTRYFAQMLLNAVRDDGRMVAGFACVVHDLTERRTAKEREAVLQSEIDVLLATSDPIRGLALELRRLIVEGEAKSVVDELLGLMKIEPAPIVENVEFSPNVLLRELRSVHDSLSIALLVDVELPNRVVGNASSIRTTISQFLEAEVALNSRRIVVSAECVERVDGCATVMFEVRGIETQSFRVDLDTSEPASAVPSPSVGEQDERQEPDLTNAEVVLDLEAGDEFSRVSKFYLDAMTKALASHDRKGAVANSRALAALSKSVGAHEIAEIAERMATSIEGESLNDPVRMLDDLRKARRSLFETRA